VILSYFDSSFVLSIILDEKSRDEAYAYWTTAARRVSSILLKIETTVSLRRIYENNKARLADDWLSEKTALLNSFLREVNYRVIGAGIEREISAQMALSGCRSLDAIHIATALQFRRINHVSGVKLYTYDTDMRNLAKAFGFKTNPCNK